MYNDTQPRVSERHYIVSGILIVPEERRHWLLPTKMNLEAFQDLGPGLGDEKVTGIGYNQKRNFGIARWCEWLHPSTCDLSRVEPSFSQWVELRASVLQGMVWKGCQGPSGYENPETGKMV